MAVELLHASVYTRGACELGESEAFLCINMKIGGQGKAHDKYVHYAAEALDDD